jgi:hypothetical protein
MACARAAAAVSSKTTARGNFLAPVVVHASTRSGVEGIPQGGVALGGATRGDVALSRESSHPSLAQSSAAPGRAGTSQRTLGDPPAVSFVHRVLPKGVTATATSTSSVDGAAEPEGARTAPWAWADAGENAKAVSAARHAPARAYARRERGGLLKRLGFVRKSRTEDLRLDCRVFGTICDVFKTATARRRS